MHIVEEGWHNVHTSMIMTHDLKHSILNNYTYKLNCKKSVIIQHLI